MGVEQLTQQNYLQNQQLKELYMTAQMQSGGGYRMGPGSPGRPGVGGSQSLFSNN